MNSAAIKLLPCLAWAAVAVSTASPVNARAMMEQNGDYVTCSSRSYSEIQAYDCDGQGSIEFSFVQQIRVASSSCSAGACSNNDGVTRVEAVYAPGRKPAYPSYHCLGTASYVYELGSCSC